MYDRYLSASPSTKHYILDQIIVQLSPYIDQLTSHLVYPHDPDDASIACNVGLLKAVDTYKNSKSSFTTYAMNHIRWALYTHLRRDNGVKPKRPDEVLWTDLGIDVEEILGEAVYKRESEDIMKVKVLTELLDRLTPVQQELVWNWILNDCNYTKDITRKQVGECLSILRGTKVDYVPGLKIIEMSDEISVCSPICTCHH